MADIIKEVPLTSPDGYHLPSVKVEKPPVDGIADTKDVADERGGINTGSDFPDGGLRAWLIVAAAVCVTMSTFGVVNSFVRLYSSTELIH
jgi:hypothetical protein